MIEPVKRGSEDEYYVFEDVKRWLRNTRQGQDLIDIVVNIVDDWPLDLEQARQVTMDFVEEVLYG